jgi:hypothetical protein
MSDYALGSWLIVASLILFIATGCLVVFGIAVIQDGRRGGCRGGGCRRSRWTHGRDHARGLEGVGLRVFTKEDQER